MYLRNKVTGAVTDNLDPQTKEYRILTEMTIASGQTELGASSPVASGGVLPLWEEIAQEDVGDDPVGGHVLVLSLPSETSLVDEVVSDAINPQFTGNVTDIKYVPAQAVAGVATNNRTISVIQTTTAGTGTVTRAINTIGSKAIDNTVNLNQYQPLTIAVSAAPLASGAPLTASSNHNGTGAPEPGGIVIVTYTRV